MLTTAIWLIQILNFKCLQKGNCSTLEQALQQPLFDTVAVANLRI